MDEFSPYLPLLHSSNNVALDAPSRRSGEKLLTIDRQR